MAIFDTVNGITRTRQGWLVNDPAPAGRGHGRGDRQRGLHGPERPLDHAPIRAPSRSPTTRPSRPIPDGQAKADGIAWGKKVAVAILAKRADSGYNKPIPGKYSSTEPGKWRETPAAFRPPLLPFWGKVTPFVMTSHSQFRAPPPETLGSKEYAEELAFVAAHGARDDADRTEYQTLCTPFWSDDLGTSTPPGHWNVIAAGYRAAQELERPGVRAAFRPPQPGRGGCRDLVLGDEVLSTTPGGPRRPCARWTPR